MKPPAYELQPGDVIVRDVKDGGYCWEVVGGGKVSPKLWRIWLRDYMGVDQLLEG